MSVSFDVLGEPKGQGSKKAWVANGRAMMTESGGHAHAAWRNAVAEKARDRASVMGQFTGPVRVIVSFRHTMPKSRPKADRARGWCWRPMSPDVDKLQRALFDGLVAGGLLRDDALIVAVSVTQIETTSWVGASVTIDSVHSSDMLDPVMLEAMS